ncbi:MAG TPA: DUF4280 domain-containing protein [Pseudobacteroides sp.]|jgi:hypothetical protein|nr:DUF4280 domain-containing protein [Pseudobacteroides sp.]
MGDEVQKVMSEEEKHSYVVAGAYLKCSASDAYSVLTAPRSHGVYIKNKAQLNIMDYKPCLNIRPFGLCKILKGACTPAVTSPWSNGKDDKLVENYPVLLNISKNVCNVGGVITIEDDGQE